MALIEDQSGRNKLIKLSCCGLVRADLFLELLVFCWLTRFNYSTGKDSLMPMVELSSSMRIEGKSSSMLPDRKSPSMLPNRKSSSM